MRLRRGVFQTPAARGGGSVAAIGAPVDLGVAFQTTSVDTAIEITTSADVAAGELICVLIASTNSKTVTSVTDAAGNTYSLGYEYKPASGIFLFSAYCIATSSLASGSTITVNFSAALGRKLASAVKASGIASPTASAYDASGAGGTATSTTPLVATPTLAQSNELLLAWSYINAGHVDTWTEATGWTQMTGAPVIDTRILRVAAKIVSSTTSINYDPVNGASRDWTTNVVCFKGA